jgi:vacuolar protein sorting-associated protein 35
LITAGSVYIQSHEAGSEKIIDDIISMLKAVQNPLRGLFLRYYFLKMCKDRLPDTGSGYETENRGIKEAIEYIHINLRESTNLWMRIGGGRDKAKRQKEKNDLKTLIGENLMRISSLEGVNIKIYKQLVLPKMLELIQNSKDPMAQEYLLDCMIQGFPEEFHINTLPELLNTCSKECEKEVDMKAIFIALMTRLSSYLSDSGNVIENVENGFSVYELFSTNIKELVKRS